MEKKLVRELRLLIANFTHLELSRYLVMHHASMFIILLCMVR